jgi:hypothetical protein
MRDDPNRGRATTRKTFRRNSATSCKRRVETPEEVAGNLVDIVRVLLAGAARWDLFPNVSAIAIHSRIELSP